MGKAGAVQTRFTLVVGWRSDCADKVATTDGGLLQEIKQEVLNENDMVDIGQWSLNRVCADSDVIDVDIDTKQCVNKCSWLEKQQGDTVSKRLFSLLKNQVKSENHNVPVTMSVSSQLQDDVGQVHMSMAQRPSLVQNIGVTEQISEGDVPLLFAELTRENGQEVDTDDMKLEMMEEVWDDVKYEGSVPVTIVNGVVSVGREIFEEGLGYTVVCNETSVKTDTNIDEAGHIEKGDEVQNGAGLSCVENEVECNVMLMSHCDVYVDVHDSDATITGLARVVRSHADSHEYHVKRETESDESTLGNIDDFAASHNVARTVNQVHSNQNLGYEQYSGFACRYTARGCTKITLEKYNIVQHEYSCKFRERWTCG